MAVVGKSGYWNVRNALRGWVCQDGDGHAPGLKKHDLALRSVPRDGAGGQVADVPVESVTFRFPNLLDVDEARPSRDRRRPGILRVHLDYSLSRSFGCRITADQADRAGRQPLSPPGRVEPVGDVDLSGGQAWHLEPQVDRARQTRLGIHAYSEGTQRSARGPLLDALAEVRLSAARVPGPPLSQRTSSSSSPARCASMSSRRRGERVTTPSDSFTSCMW